MQTDKQEHISKVILCDAHEVKSVTVRMFYSLHSLSQHFGSRQETSSCDAYGNDDMS